MSSSGIKRKLRPAKKAWKKLTSTLQSKLRRLNRSKPIKRTATGLNAAVSTILRRRPHNRRAPPTRPPPPLRRKLHRRHWSFAPVYVDELFNDLTPPAQVKVVGPPPVERGDKAAANLKGSSSSAAAAVVEQELVGVDLRAEMFIAKFREEMRLQRQRSFGEYQEMLTRAV